MEQAGQLSTMDGSLGADGKQRPRPQPMTVISPTASVRALAALVTAGQRFSTVYADPHGGLPIQRPVPRPPAMT